MQSFLYLHRAKLFPFLWLSMAGGAFAQGHSCSSPSAMGTGTYSGTVWDNQSDYYEVNVSAGQTFILNETMDTHDCIYALYESGCLVLWTLSWAPGLNSLVWVNDTGAAATVTLMASQYGTPSSLTSSYTFDFSLDVSPCTPDGFEGNNDCASATMITAGTYTGLNVSIGDEDYFTVNVPAGMQIAIVETQDDNNDVFWRISAAGCNTTPGADTSFSLWTNDTGAPVDVSVKADYQYSGGPLCADYSFDLAIAQDLCYTIQDDHLEENDDCASAISVADGTYVGLQVTTSDKDHYAFQVRTGSTVSIDIVHQFADGDVDGFLRAAGSLECGSGYNGGLDLLAFAFTSLDNESITWTNTTGADLDVVLEVNMQSVSQPDCNTYDLTITGSGDPNGGVIGSTFCDPMDANSTGASTRLSAFWGTGVGSDLHLEATSGPPSQVGYFLVGTGASDPGLALSQGRLCLDITAGNSIGRYNVGASTLQSIGMFDASGILQSLLGTSTIGSGFDVPLTVPISGLPQTVAGSTWHFQLWHRENGGASNFSNGLSVTF